MHYIFESIFVGIYASLIFVLLSKSKTRFIYLLFITGFLKHLLGYILNIHTYYCNNGYACKKILTNNNNNNNNNNSVIKNVYKYISKNNIFTLLFESILEGIVFSLLGNIIIHFIIPFIMGLSKFFMMKQVFIGNHQCAELQIRLKKKIV